MANQIKKSNEELILENKVIVAKLEKTKLDTKEAAELIKTAAANLRALEANAKDMQQKAEMAKQEADMAQQRAQKMASNNANSASPVNEKPNKSKGKIIEFKPRIKRNIEDIPLDERTGVLEFRDLRKSFNGKKILKGVDAKFEPGKVYGFLGNNGAGKTTTMRILFNMEEATGGKIVYVTKDVDKDGKIIDKEIKHGDIDFSEWFYFTEIDSIPTNYTVHNYLWELAILYDMPLGEFHYREREIMNFLDVNFTIKNKISSLSSGQQKLVNCIALLLVKPNIVFLDEPTANMDVWNQRIIMKIIEKLKSENRIIVITTHLLKEIGDALTDVVILDEGVVTYQAPLKKGDDLQQIFRDHTTDTTEQDFANVDGPNAKKQKKTYEHNSFDRKMIGAYLND